MLIVYGVPADTDPDNKLTAKQLADFSDAFLARKGEFPENVLLLMVSYKPDKRLKLYKFLQDKAQIKAFPRLSPVQLKLFIKKEFSGLSIDDVVLDYFLIKIGKDLYRLSSEIEKLHMYMKDTNTTIVDKKLIDMINYGQIEVNSFLFFDYLLPQKEKAIRILDKIHASGGDIYQTLGMLYWGLKLYIYLIDLYQQGIHDNKTLASMCKYHPFVVAKVMKHITQLVAKKNALYALFRDFVRLDFAIKSGKLPASAFWLETKKLIYHRDLL
ncbi:MAG: hypothetical protein GXP45_05045 [bacterium]|nr:hypothetical protein [bacterium]